MPITPPTINVSIVGNTVHVSQSPLTVESVGTAENCFVVWHPVACAINRITFSNTSINAHPIAFSGDWQSSYMAPSSNTSFSYTICATADGTEAEKCHDPEIDNVTPPGPIKP